MTRLSNLGRATFLTLSSSFALFPFVFSNPASASSSNSSSETTEHKTVLVTASRLNEDSASSSANVTIITADEIRDSAASNLVDLLGTKAGVFTNSLYGNGKEASVGLRSFGKVSADNTLILLDGKRLNVVDMSTVDLSSIPMDNVERVEIIRGGGSVLYGDSAVGGVINIITKAPEPGVSKSNLTVGSGSFTHRKAALSNAFGGEGGAVHTYVKRELSDGFRENSELEQTSAAVDARSYQGFGELYIKVNADKQEMGLPGGLSDVQIRENPRTTYTPNDYFDQKDASVNLGSVFSLASHSEFLFDLGYRTRDREAFNWSFQEYELDTYSLTPRYQLRLDDFNLTAGVDFYDTAYGAERAASSTAIPHEAFNYDLKSTSTYFMADQSLDAQNSLQYGARWQSMRYDSKDVTPNGATAGLTSTERYEEPGYELGFVHRFDDEYSQFIRYTRAVRVANLDELKQFSPTTYAFTGFQLLKPQTSDGFEIGLRKESRKLHGYIALYHMKLKNEIGFDAMALSNINFDRTKHSGVEFELGASLTERTEMVFNYSGVKATFETGNYEGKDVPFVPKHSGSVAANHEINKGLKASAIMDFVGRHYRDGDSTNTSSKAPSRALLNLKLSAKAEQMTVDMSLNNVLDKETYDYSIPGWSSDYDAYPLPGRNANIRLSYDF